MAINLATNHEGEEDYIDMEIGSHSNFLCHPAPSPPWHQNPREFEFQMSSTPLQTESTTSPADELFYRGKLLPLHLPPRLQMFEAITNFSATSSSDPRNIIRESESSSELEEFFSTPLITNATPTPFDSCTVSPFESCRVSRELNPDEHLHGFSTTTDPDFNGMSSVQNSKKSWTRKIKLMKQSSSSSIGSKLKASRAYLKSLFGKSEQPNSSASQEPDPKAKQPLALGNKAAKTKHQRLESSLSCEKDKEKEKEKEKKKTMENGHHRRSFSVSIKRHYSSNNTCSKNSNGLQLLKRSSSVSSSGVESPIQGAIAHCKKSQHILASSRKTLCEITGFYSISSARISVSEDHENVIGISRG